MSVLSRALPLEGKPEAAKTAVTSSDFFLRTAHARLMRLAGPVLALAGEAGRDGCVAGASDWPIADTGAEGERCWSGKKKRLAALRGGRALGEDERERSEAISD